MMMVWNSLEEIIVEYLFVQSYKWKYGYLPSLTWIKVYLYHADPGGDDTDPDDTNYYNSYSREYGYGIIDIWEAVHDIFY